MRVVGMIHRNDCIVVLVRIMMVVTTAIIPIAVLTMFLTNVGMVVMILMMTIPCSLSV